MNLSVDYSKKDLVKSLGCRWSQENKKWVCPLTNTDANIESLIKLQETGNIGFIKGVKIHPNNVDLKNTDAVYHKINTGPTTFLYELCFTREQILEQIAERKTREIIVIEKSELDKELDKLRQRQYEEIIKLKELYAIKIN